MIEFIRQLGGRAIAIGVGFVFLGATGACFGKARRDATTLEFLPPGGVFTNDVAVRITASTAGAVIHFTLDGSLPTARSPVFTNAIALTNCAVIKARLIASNRPVSEVVVANYILLAPGLAWFDSNLPLIILDSSGQEVPRDTRVGVSVRCIEPGNGRAGIAGPAQFDGRGELSLRGRSSLRYLKRSYNLRTVDAVDDSLKVSLLGFPREWDWILYGPHPDKTLMRDVLAYDLSNEMGRYATRTRFVELFLNETGGRLTPESYLGVYVLMERIKQGKQRVNVAKLGPDDLTEPNVSGGYLVRKDHVDRFEPGAPSLAGFPDNVGSPTVQRYGYPTGPGGFPGDPAGFQPPYTGSIRESSSSSSSRSSSSSSRATVTNRLGGPLRRDVGLKKGFTGVVSDSGDDDLPSHMEGFRSQVASNHLYYVDPPAEEVNAVQRAWFMNYVNAFDRTLYGPDFRNPTNGYVAYIDSDSFIDHHLIVEMTKNVDGFRFSTFYHKDRGGRLCMGPIWDYNFSLGNAGHGKQGWMPEYWFWPQLDNREYPWFRRLFEDPDFGQRYVDRFAELRKTLLATSNVTARIDGMARLLREAQARNFKRWPILGMEVWPNRYVGQTYEDEVNWMKDWFLKRLEWMEKQFVPAPTVMLQAGQVTTSGAGAVFYTLDGTDPRAPGGETSATAKDGKLPVQITRETVVMARARVEQRWSAPTRVRLTPAGGQ